MPKQPPAEQTITTGPFKFVVTAFLLRRDETGAIVGEATAAAMELYGTSLKAVAERYDAELEMSLAAFNEPPQTS